MIQETITIPKELAEKILFQLEAAQEDVYVQATQNVINELKTFTTN